MTVQIIVGDARERLKELPSGSVDCCVTSPPYFGLRDYGVDGQLGLEPTPDDYVSGMVCLFREVRRVLRDDGTLWLNIGDSYKTDGKRSGLKPKDLIGIPWRVAFALQSDGWYLRQDIVWHKPNPMPESVRDRCTKAHEYLFLLTKSPRYYFDGDAISEPLGEASIARLSQDVESQKGSDRVPGKTNGPMKAVGGRRASGNRSHKCTAAYQAGDETMRLKSGLMAFAEREKAKVEAGDLAGMRNKRSVWTVATQPFSGAHFATFPPALIEPCILAGCPVGGLVLDPFGGAGTTGLVAERLGRSATLIELNPDYADLARDRLRAELCRVESEAPEPEYDAGPLFGRFTA